MMRDGVNNHARCLYTVVYLIDAHHQLWPVAVVKCGESFSGYFWRGDADAGSASAACTERELRESGLWFLIDVRRGD